MNRQHISLTAIATIGCLLAGGDLGVRGDTASASGELKRGPHGSAE